ncbi:Serine/threonine-protein kinase TEL1 [Erysiphe neolycopersici]|uniref:Serine/threonine-protein kinase Tel1 n=1 Tax=Erysiphe neolycopersici TaxID=212602 RepID=A0A420I3I3_9PEZI|nr:Serine/threonine-protein kinase TEL1 [Erysiphe neolycopersici]
MSSDGTDIQLDIVLALILSSKLKERNDGLNDLKKFFERSRNVSNLFAFKDKTYNRIFEVLFKTIILEKQVYSKTKKSIKPLELCSTVMRLVVKAATPRIKPKTVNLLVEHHIQVLTPIDGKAFHTLTKDYLKNLTLIFKHAPNLENLKVDIWLDTIDFCLQALSQAIGVNHGDSIILTPNSTSFNILRSSSIKHQSEIHYLTSQTSLTRQNIDEFFQILYLLVSTPNSKISMRYSVIGDTVLRFLQSQNTSICQTNQLAFGIINVVLHFTRFEFADYTKTIAREIIPIICRFFKGKVVSKDEMLNSIRDEMLITICNVHLHLESMTMDIGFHETLSELVNLLEVMRGDYMKRPDRDQLQIDDLEFKNHQIENVNFFHLCSFNLRAHNYQAERNWGFLKIIGILERLVCLIKHFNSLNNKHSNENPQKRRRSCEISDRLVESIATNDERIKLAGLQVLPFSLENLKLSSYGLRALLAHLYICSDSKNSKINAWTLLVIASCSFQYEASNIENPEWMKFWLYGVRSLTHPSTCRTASVLLYFLLAKRLVKPQDVGEFINLTLTTAESNGPVSISDASIFLMVNLLKTRVIEVPNTSTVIALQIIRWLFGRWKPVERHYAMYNSIHVQPKHIFLLLKACLGLEQEPFPTATLPCGRLAQIWQKLQEESQDLRYLLLIDESPLTNKNEDIDSQPSLSFTDPKRMSSILSTKKFLIARKLILELLNSTCTNFLHDWKSYMISHFSSIPEEIYCNAVYCCIVMLSMLTPYMIFETEEAKILTTNSLALANELTNSISEILKGNSGDHKKIKGVLFRVIEPYLPYCGVQIYSSLARDTPFLLDFFVMIADVIETFRIAQNESQYTSTNIILSDNDDFLPTQDSQSIKFRQNSSAMPRSCMALNSWIGFFENEVIGRLYLLAAIKSASNFEGLVPTTFIDYLISLTDEEFISNQRLILNILASDLIINDSDSSRLVERIGNILSCDLLGRCEVTLIYCVEILAALKPFALTSAKSDVAESAVQIYQWLVNTAIGKNLATPEVQKSMSRLLVLVLHSKDPEFGATESTSSARSCLFKILRNAHLAIKFSIVDQIAKIFQLFILKDHDMILTDILDILPTNADWLEGISFRLFVIAKLGSALPTLLRRCIYYIFETPAKVTQSSAHATRCIKEISTKLEISSPQELFKFYASQLLYTWLEWEDIKDVPFHIFGFNSLFDLVDVAKEESTALMVMRGQQESIQQLASILSTDEALLVQNSFTKVMAYSIANDLDRPQISSNTDSESFIKKRLGEKLFFQSIDYHFVDIIATFFNCIDQEQTAKKYFIKTNELEYAGNILEKIFSFSSSDVILPTNQQPLFKVKFLIPEIQSLCSLAQRPFKSIFTPALVISIARSLFNRSRLEFGSHYACSVLRKLRILISLSGDVAITGYPLEMLLHSLRYFLQNLECVDDAIGILQYLLEAGSAYLFSIPSFVTGISISIFCSLSQTYNNDIFNFQGGQQQSTKKNIRKFQTWFGNYLKSYSSPSLLTSRKDNDFRALIDAASNIESIGNADINSPESNLLIGILRDEGQSGSLLNKSSRETALSILTLEFRGPVSYSKDTCSDDKKSLWYAPAILKSYRTSFAREYRIWAARVVGRAFAFSGKIHEEFIYESKLNQIRDLSVPHSGMKGSTTALLRLLLELVVGYDLKVIGIAEIALRYIVEVADKDLAELCKKILPESLLIASSWNPYQLPPTENLDSIETLLDTEGLLSFKEISKSWLRNFSIALAKSIPKDPLLASMVLVLTEVTGFADKAFPFLVHLALSSHSCKLLSKDNLSLAYNSWLETPKITKSIKKMLLDSILYLRTRVLPNEKSPAERAYWLEIDYLIASTAAISCGMFKTALLCFEEYYSHSVRSLNCSSSNFRENSTPYEANTNILLQIYKNIDDLDLYYGVKQHADWNTVLARFNYEKDGFKSLAFKGANFDSQIRGKKSEYADGVQSLVRAFDVMSLSGVSNSLLQAHQTVCISETSVDSLFRTSRKLEQWDVPVPMTYSSNHVAIYKVFQTIYSASDFSSVKNGIDEGLEFAMDKIIKRELSTTDLHETLQTLAALVEIDEIFGSSGSHDLENIFNRFRGRSHWMRVGNLDDVNSILSCRSTALSMLSQSSRLQEMIKIKTLDSRYIEVQTALLASKIIRAHSNLQESLSLTTSMIDLITPCRSVGINVEAAVYLESANTLWDQGEVSTSIDMLKALDNPSLLNKQAINVGRSLLLAKIGHQVSVAKLEKADRIIDQYLGPALKELNGQFKGGDAGQVFHQFAIFCDQQLQDPDLIEELERVKNLSKTKAEEVKDYDRLIAEAKSVESKRDCLSRQMKAKAWLRIDERDLKHQIAIREELLSHCLENYLLSLIASNDHNRNAHRFLALWLEHSAEDVANNAVAKYLGKVPSMKFASLMNQLTSRLQDTKEKFHELIFQVILRICTDHPYHGMYQIFSGAFGNVNEKDEVAISRRNATKLLASRFNSTKISKEIWFSIQSSSKAYCILAGEKNNRYKAGKKFQLNESSAAMALNAVVKKYPIPSPTRQILLSASLDYSKVPKVIRLKSEFTIASGVSAPKIIVAIDENGEQFKQLVKGGNDDLRQDAIMEQVFDQVNELLKTNRSTQQRRLRIRTYRVLPLTNIAGIIEFVPNTIPLHEYLMPAHERFYPKDLKASRCRNEIAAVQAKGSELRIKTFRAVTERFHPVMRYFFTENFLDPDEWFFKRLAYVRSTAAISILGYVLGLGDRHAHNLLLDQKSGEIVHIDLGIAFEMGRILPIPETVPFRLTRDIVDGMGITKTEGVFRRCCEATLEALQAESLTIMSTLDVLRYDPLHSWSVSPVRLAKLREEQQLQLQQQQEQQQRQDSQGLTTISFGSTSTVDHKLNEKKLINEPGEAARALSSVNKKLTKSLSVYATVNDLINQASDEKNLALLFAGWAAYA